MAEYALAHVGINAENEEEAVKTARLFEALFGLPVKAGGSSVFAGSAVEVMKQPYLGRHGHIGFAVSDVDAAKTELENKGFYFALSTAKYLPDGRLHAIYLSDEIGGFAVHLVGKQ